MYHILDVFLRHHERKKQGFSRAQRMLILSNWAGESASQSLKMKWLPMLPLPSSQGRILNPSFGAEVAVHGRFCCQRENLSFHQLVGEVVAQSGGHACLAPRSRFADVSRPPS